jgi:uncharacterized membrane protein
MKVLLTYLATFAVFVAIDLVWLGIVAKDFYRSGIGHLMGEGFNLPAAIVFYLIYIAGVMMFAILPAAQTGDWTRAAMLGAAFGFFAYATYDLTNLATLKNWPLSLALADMAWGSFVTALAASAGYAAYARL